MSCYSKHSICVNIRDNLLRNLLQNWFKMANVLEKLYHTFLCLALLLLIVLTPGLGDETLIKDTPTSGTSPSTPNSPKTTTNNSTKANTTDQVSVGDNTFMKILNNKGMLYRTFIVLAVVTFIIVLYFGIKYWRWLSFDTL